MHEEDQNAPQPQPADAADLPDAGTTPAESGAMSTQSHSVVAAPARPEEDLRSVPVAEMLPPERDTVTPTPLAPDAPYVFADLDDQTFHTTLSAFVRQAQGQYAEFGLTLYYRILPGLQDAQRRFKEHEKDSDYRLDGCAGIEQYIKKLGLTPARVRKWRQRDKERQFTREIKLLAGGSVTCPECGRGKGHTPSCPHCDAHMTETQRAVVQALVAQGFKKDAVAMVKAAEGQDFDSLFRSALAHRANREAGMTTEFVEKPDTQVEQPDSRGAADKLAADLAAEPDRDVAGKLLTEHLRGYIEGFANQRIKISVEASVTFAGRERRIMPGDLLESRLADSAASTLCKCTDIADDGQSSVMEWDDTLKGWGKARAVAADKENLYRVVTEARAREIAPDAVAVQNNEKKRLDALETIKAVGGRLSSEIKKLVADPKSHCYDIDTLKTALSARLAFEAAQ